MNSIIRMTGTFHRRSTLSAVNGSIRLPRSQGKGRLRHDICRVVSVPHVSDLRATNVTGLLKASLISIFSGLKGNCLIPAIRESGKSWLRKGNRSKQIGYELGLALSVGPLRNQSLMMNSNCSLGRSTDDHVLQFSCQSVSTSHDSGACCTIAGFDEFVGYLLTKCRFSPDPSRSPHTR